MIGPIRQELLSGIKEQVQFEKLRTSLAAFRDETIDTSDYEEAARLYNVCRTQGVECGPVDILICAVAVRRKWSVLANDASLNKCFADHRCGSAVTLGNLLCSKTVAERGYRISPVELLIEFATQQACQPEPTRCQQQQAWRLRVSRWSCPTSYR